MFKRTAPWMCFALLCVAVASGQTPATPREDSRAEEQLPDGEGKKILTTACTTCHGLDEVMKFRGYYTRDDWRDIVVTMVKYGAELKDGEAEILVNYLGEHLARK